MRGSWPSNHLGRRLTYRELNSSANRLAWALLERRGLPGGVVGLLLDQGAPFVIAIFGTLKAGKAFVPLDPRLPARRLAFMAEHAGMDCIVTDSKGLALASSFGMQGPRVFNIDELDDRLAAHDPDLSIDPGSMSYMIYTSGSTGTPKGVVQRHRNALHNVMRLSNELQFSSDDRLTWLASGGTTQAVGCIFLALLNGASLFSYSVRYEGLANLARWLRDEEITFYYSSASVFRFFVETLNGGESLPRLRAIRLGGEPVTIRDLELFNRHFSNNCICINSLASTEACGTYRINVIRKGSTFTGPLVPVGYPVEGMKVLLLDDSGRPVRDGEIGEIAIQSRYLSPGYWDKGQLNFSDFRPDPHGGGETIFRTGDLGRMGPGERLDLLGRKDSQLKIRGYRVEIAEIELKLLGLDSVKEAVVLVEHDERGDHRLTAYVVLAEKNAMHGDGLRQYLTAELPDYMVPWSIIAIDSFPLTPSGKIDRKALAAWKAAGNQQKTSFVSPCTPVDRELAGIWAEVLDHDAVSLNDRFLDIGGTSLRATQVATRVVKHLGVELTVREILDASMLSELSALITRKMAEKSEVRDLEQPAVASAPNGCLPQRSLFITPAIAESPTEIETLRSDGSTCPGQALMRIDREPVSLPPLSYAQQRLWFLEQLEGHLTTYNIARAWRLTGPLDVDVLRQALEAVVLRHEPLRTVFSLQGDRTYQFVLPPSTFELPVHDLRDVPDAELDAELTRRATAEAERPFDLTQDLCLRAQVLRLADHDHVLLLSQHHIASDGWSQQVLWRELKTFYSAHLHGAMPSLPELPCRYVDYTVWQRERLEGFRLQPELDYWRKQLAGLEPLRLPTDRTRPSQSSHRGAEHEFQLDADLVQRLRELSSAAVRNFADDLAGGATPRCCTVSLARTMWRWACRSRVA